ncbi:amidohydrolase [Desulfosporosinus sp. PR]|uniref:amidohydrolase n=1 Tax=Candidatus Desulfosporosinus nitrosoreducens TaxID=3401928 RepID=UPI0027F61D3D|nr:amidohydrolase [Desulfosporosinus sp. PR]MDQ7092185.1 amidohydrolase [Desulfosporosinus sp. PR]
MERTILIRNAKAIVTCDAQDHVYYGADMLVNGPKIVKIGAKLTDKYDEVIDATDKFIYPGLVNTHHHFFQTFVRNLKTIDYPNMTVPEWLDKIYRIFQVINDEVIYYSSLTALGDLIKHGCTCAFDLQYCFTKATGKAAVDRQMEAAKLLGIRYHAGRGTNTLPLSEGSTIPDNMLETTDEYLEDCDRLIKLYHDPTPYAMARIVMAPCQPINCYKETFSETVKFAREKGVRMHTHLGEGENQIMVDRWGKRTLDWCSDLGFIGDDVWIAHAWELLPEEYVTLGKAGTGISHCPAPAILAGMPILNMKELQRNGLLVSLGCDGSATNDSSNLLDSMRMAWMMQAFYSKERGGCITPYEMLKIATANGAQTLGRNDLGSLEPEKGADLFMIDAGKLELTGTLHDPKNLLTRTGVTGYVDLTMINGKVVFQDGILQNVDERKLAREGEEVCTRVLREPCEAFHNLD